MFGSNGVVGVHNKAITAGPTIIVGRKGSFGKVSFSPDPCWPIDTTYYVDETATSVNLKWLAYRLSGLSLTTLNRAAAIPGLNREDAYRQPLLLPSYAEQQSIAAVLDKADALRAKRRAALAQLDMLAKSIFLDMFGDPATNPRGWDRRPLMELGVVITGKTPPSAKLGMFGDTVPFITPGDLESEGPVKRGVTDAGANESATVSPGATLICCIGATIGKIGTANARSAFNQQINAVQWGEKINWRYGFEALRFFRRAIVALGTSTTLPILKKSSFERMEIPVPPMQPQREFARQISAVEAVKATQRPSLAEMNHLFASLQHRAFRGEL